MPDITPFWISIQVAVISTIIVSVLGIFVCRLLYKGKGHLTKLLESFILLPIVLPHGARVYFTYNIFS